MSAAVQALMSMYCVCDPALMSGRLCVCVADVQCVAAGVTATAVVSLSSQPPPPTDLPVALMSALPPGSTDDTQLHENSSLFPKLCQCPCLVLMSGNTKYDETLFFF